MWGRGWCAGGGQAAHSTAQSCCREKEGSTHPGRCRSPSQRWWCPRRQQSGSRQASLQHSMRSRRRRGCQHVSMKRQVPSRYVQRGRINKSVRVSGWVNERKCGLLGRTQRVKAPTALPRGMESACCAAGRLVPVPGPRRTKRGAESAAADSRRQRGAYDRCTQCVAFPRAMYQQRLQREDGTSAGRQCVWRDTQLPRQCEQNDRVFMPRKDAHSSSSKVQPQPQPNPASRTQPEPATQRRNPPPPRAASPTRAAPAPKPPNP